VAGIKTLLYTKTKTKDEQAHKMHYVASIYDHRGLEWKRD